MHMYNIEIYVDISCFLVVIIKYIILIQDGGKKFGCILYTGEDQLNVALGKLKNHITMNQN